MVMVSVVRAPVAIHSEEYQAVESKIAMQLVMVTANLKPTASKKTAQDKPMAM